MSSAPTVALASRRLRFKIHLLQKGFGLLPTSSRAPPTRFVSIDCEFAGPTVDNGVRELGFCVFDSEALEQLSIADTGAASLTNFQESLTSFNFNFTDIRSSPQKLSQFFGSNAARVDRSEVRRIMQDFSSSATDNVVLVGHALFNDLWRMNKDGFGRPQAAVLDTMRIAEGITPIGRQLSLEDLAIRYNIPRQKFHVAGNDAYYTMQVLFMLAVESVKEKQLNPQQRERVSILEALARMPIPGQEIANKFRYSSAVAIAQEKMAKWRRLHPEVVGYKLNSLAAVYRFDILVKNQHSAPRAQCSVGAVVQRWESRWLKAPRSK
ncbi:hypothetical protein LZ554_006467 [Drepanopeziza brunnea f. sp. 'monogermtubi']|nr:hypothetical protein LZ554_006467 [Drepanopeziza brunnea f. sp. 'monogermtubi']